MERWNRGRKVHIPDYDPKKRVVCEVCGADIKLQSYRKYTVSGQQLKGGLSSIAGAPEKPKLYDAFDCPVCGCQYVAKERLRNAE